MNEPLTTEDLLALAVLQRKGPEAIRMLLDILLEKYGDGRQQITPIRELAKVNTEDIQALVFFDYRVCIDEEIEVDYENTQRSVFRWLAQGGVCALSGVDRIELYEFKPPLARVPP